MHVESLMLGRISRVVRFRIAVVWGSLFAGGCAPRVQMVMGVQASVHCDSVAPSVVRGADGRLLTDVSDGVLVIGPHRRRDGRSIRAVFVDGLWLSDGHVAWSAGGGATSAVWVGGSPWMRSGLTITPTGGRVPSRGVLQVDARITYADPGQPPDGETLTVRVELTCDAE